MVGGVSSMVLGVITLLSFGRVSLDAPLRYLIAPVYSGAL